MAETSGHNSQIDFQEKINTLRLWRSYSIGNKRFRYLIEKFQTATAVIEYIKIHKEIDIFDNYGEKISKFYSHMLFSEEEAKKEVNKIYEFGAQVISITDEIYKNSFQIGYMIHHAPCVLTVKGNLDLLKTSTVAVVGSRIASTIGKKWTEKFCKEIGKNFTIVSGLARGIDTAAHENSINTIAVLGSGINKIYPTQNEKLYQNISRNGLIISEFPFNHEPQSSYFLRRNNTIAAISWGVVVVEAALNSGSLTTANSAIEQGKDVFAVPNHPFDLRSQGTNMLLKNGAYLVENANDFLSIYSQLANRQIADFTKQKRKKPCYTQIQLNTALNSESINTQDEKENSIISCLSYVPISVDEICDTTGKTLTDVFTSLMQLEIEGKIQRDSNGMIFLKK